MIDYESFVAQKLTRVPPTGMSDVPELHANLFPFQRDIAAWALRRGRAAVFADCGLGKSFVQLEWARHVAAHTSMPVLILAPLVVTSQTVREAARFGIEAMYARKQADASGPIVVANYEMLEHFDADAFGGVVLDESSILKAFDGKTRTLLVGTFAATPFRLACTATPAPNDHIELGNHAAFLGICTREEMMAEYFINDGSDTSSWRLKGHAVGHFWDWVASWAVAVRKPSDLGHEDTGYDLPGLTIRHHVVASEELTTGAGMLFAMPARGLDEQRKAKRASISGRVAKVAELVAAEASEQWIVWVELNDEGDMAAATIPGAVQISGSDSADEKEARLLAFIDGSIRVLVTKKSIAGFGINAQGCARMAFASISHSYEQFFQAIRRCHRFGQTREVVAHVICSEAESEVLESLKRKESDAEAMMAAMVASMRGTQMTNVRGSTNAGRGEYAARGFTVPCWLGSAS